MRFTVLCLCLVLAPFVAFAQMETSARQAILIDYDTGTVLFEKDADQRMPTSSMSKVMTLYMIFEALQKGQITLDTKFTVSEKAWRKGGSKMFVKVDDQVTVENLIRGVAVQSGNDATIVLAEGLAGSEDIFADALNSRAQALGMEKSHFINASGWPDPEHYSTARDLAILAQAIIENFPEYYPYFAETEFTYAGIKQPNRNPLLFQSIKADGLKTGHTEDGGYGLIGTGVGEDGRRVIMVLNGMASEVERKTESLRLLKWALSGFKIVHLFKDERALDDVPVYLGTRNSVALVAKEPLSVLVPKFRVSDVSVEIKYDAPLKAPIAKGALLGMAYVSVPNKLEKIEVPLIAAHSVEEIPLFLRLLAKARLVTTGQGRFE